jgi:hypothetical protein
MAECWEPLNKNLLSTGALVTEKATDMQDETEWTTDRGKIAQRACIAALDARGCHPTRGAQSCWGYGTQSECDLLCYLYPFHFDIEKIGKNDHKISFVLHKQSK